MNVNIHVHVPVISSKNKEITVNAANSGKREGNKTGKGEACILTKDKNKASSNFSIPTLMTAYCIIFCLFSFVLGVTKKHFERFFLQCTTISINFIILGGERR